METIRREIAGRVRSLVGSGEMSLARPPGDTGLFGPGSPSWAVHGDFTSMMIGGVAALLLQMLHPAAMAGVWDHSGFRRDMTGRLKRTAQYVGGTTFGSTAVAEALVDRVRRVHSHVRGTLPDERTREVSRLLIAQPSPSLATAPFNAVMMAAGVDLLPAWARRMHGLEQPYPDAALRAGARGVGRVLRWALR